MTQSITSAKMFVQDTLLLFYCCISTVYNDITSPG